MNATIAQLKARLAALDITVSNTDSDLADCGHDWWPPCAKWTEEETLAHRPACVVRPVSESQVVATVRACKDLNLSLVPFGAGSGVTGAAVPIGKPVTLDLRGMHRVSRIDKDRGMVTVEPGVIAGQLEQKLGSQGWSLGHYPQSLSLASIGGLIATRSSGTFSNKYGGIEHLVTGLTVVLENGDVVRFPSTPRSATGPMILPLFIGSEGSLGIITEATLRIFPKAPMRIFHGYAFAALADCIAAIRSASDRHVLPAVLRAYDQTEAGGLYQRVGLDNSGPLLITGHEGAEPIVAAESDYFASIMRSCGATPLGTAIGEAWEAHRFDASWLTEGNLAGRMADAIEVAAHWPDILPLYEAVMERIRPLCTRVMAHLSHFYSDGAAIYFIFFLHHEDSRALRERYARVWRETLDATLEFNGALSHHHGIGLARAEYLDRFLGSSHRLLARIKHALDPDHRLNPGKLGLTR